MDPKWIIPCVLFQKLMMILAIWEHIHFDEDGKS